MADGQTRRDWMRSAPALAASAAAAGGQSGGGARPNVVLVISDQFRADCVGAMGLNPMNLTPNLDRMAKRGVIFRQAMSNQPVCAPARATIFTGQYPARHGVWRNGLGLAEDATTLASEMNRAGYSTNYIGKWHLARPEPGATGETRGFVKPGHRGGFAGVWEAANALEWTSHAYEGDLFDAAGNAVHFAGQYRADFLTSRAERFLRSQAARSPFLLTVAYLETHHQNDRDTYDPPKEYAGRYPNPFVPPDLRALPGSWPSQLSDYYACAARIDDQVGRLRQTLAETGLDRNTIFAFTSDHGCHFRTRNSEYKRSPHDSSLHVPLIVEGPGLNRGLEIPELVSHIDYAPSLLAAAGLPVPAAMQGRSFLPLLDRKSEGWRDEVYFELSEFSTGRGLRTPQHTYAVTVPKTPGWKSAASAEKYVESALYDRYADPWQLLNLAGRVPHQKVAEELRKRLLARMREAGDASATIDPAWFPYP
jgi:arylsulfatase A-like enzyme